VRTSHEQEVNRLAAPFFMAHTRWELTREAQRRRILIMPVQDIGEACRDPQFAARGFFHEMRHPELDGTLIYPGAPYQIPQAPWRLRGLAPRPGQHNDELFAEVGSSMSPPMRMQPVPKAQDQTPDSGLPLRGIRVLDFTWWIAGPAATKLLAAHGAEVVKIESATRLDPVRALEPVPPDRPGVNSGGYFNNLNTDKDSVTLNLGAPAARALVCRLVALSDVVFENFAGPWVMERWGLDYDSLARINPGLIMVSMPAIGPDGPLSHYRALGNHLQAMLGLNAMTGYPDRPPVGIGAVAFPDHGCNPFHALTALLAALAYRARTGRGGHVVVPQYESTACFIGPALLDYTLTGRVPPRIGNAHPDAAPHGVYRCRPEGGDADRWLAIGVFTEVQWRSLCVVTGRPRLVADPRFATLAARLSHREELDREIEAWTTGRPARRAMEQLQAAGVPAARVANARDLLEDDPQMRARGHYVALDHPAVGRIQHDAPPFRLSRTPGRIRRPAPLLGAHTASVLQELVGLADAEVSALVMEGAVE
jgi:crotonobetainyl-CoA:carnitine CoA-transferase CaiB-like acyl-CoA transferase